MSEYPTFQYGKSRFDQVTPLINIRQLVFSARTFTSCSYTNFTVLDSFILYWSPIRKMGEIYVVIGSDQSDRERRKAQKDNVSHGAAGKAASHDGSGT